MGKYRTKEALYGRVQVSAARAAKQRNQDARRPVVLRDEWRATHPRKPKDRQPTAGENQVEAHED